MIRVTVMGASGKMGGRIISLIKDQPDELRLSGAVERKGLSAIGRDAGEIAGCGPLGIPVVDTIETVLSDSDVVIDFTEPAVTLGLLPAVGVAKKAIVIGTTGFSKVETDKIREYARKIPCVLSPNMSVGVNLVFKLLADTAKVTGDDYDVEIMEIHHHHRSLLILLRDQRCHPGPPIIRWDLHPVHRDLLESVQHAHNLRHLQ